MDEKIIAINGAKVTPQEKNMHTNIMQRSELVHEIISRKPGFVEKWTLLIFLGILLMMLITAWFINYPDIIETNAILTADNAPKEIIPRQEGRLVKLFINNNGKVNKNEIIGWIESTANHEEVLKLSAQLDSSIKLFTAGESQKVSALFNCPYSNLGEAQQAYQGFITSLQQFNDYMVNGFYTRKMQMLQNDIQSLETANKIIQHQKALTEQDLKLSEETFNMNKILSDEKVLSKDEFRMEKSKYVNKQLAIPQMESSLLTNENQKRDKQKEIDQLQHDIGQQQQIFQQALQSLKSTIDEWKKKYILESPVDGKVFFAVPLQENQFLQQGKLIGYINPEDSHFYMESYLPQNNFGKIDTGLKVQLRFDAYPYQELGVVDGTLSYVSNVASDSGFLAKVRLDKGLITNSNKVIPYRSGLKARAVVITKNMRLLQRLWYNINKTASVGTK